MSYPRTFELETRAWTTSAQLAIKLAAIPPGTRVKAIELIIETVVTNSTGGAITLAPGELAQVLSRVFLDSDLFKCDLSGRDLWKWYRFSRGRNLENNGRAMNDAATATVECRIMIPLGQENAEDVNASAIPAELLEGKQLQVSAAAVNTVRTSVTVANFTLRTKLHLVAGGGIIVPTGSVMKSLTTGINNTDLLSGGYVGLMVSEDSEQSITEAEYEEFRVDFDGQLVVGAGAVARFEDLRAGWNDIVATGGAVDDLDGGQLEENTIPFGPVIYMPHGFTMGHVPFLINAGRADVVSGTATSIRWVYRKLDIRSEAQAMAALRLQGVENPETAVLAVKTLDGGSLSGSVRDLAQRGLLARVLPLVKVG